jgi:O-antigen/teichoic acid export membrane protein
LNRQTEKASAIAEDSPHLRVSASPRRFSVHVAWTLLARVLMTVNSVAAGIIVARWLEAEGLGQLAVINVAVATILQLSSAGLPSANTYFIARDRRSLTTVAINSLAFALVVGSILALGLTGLAVWRPHWFGFISPQLIGIAAISIPFQLLTLLGLNIFLATGRIGLFNQLDMAGQSLVLVNALVALVMLGAGIWTLVTLNTAAAIVLSLVMVWLIRRYIMESEERTARRSDFALLKQMMKYGVKFHIATLSGLLIFRIDLLIVGHFHGLAQAGVYSVASQFAMMLVMLPGVIATLLFPRVTAEREERVELTCRATRHTTFVMFLVCLVSVPLSFILPLLYGEAFMDVTAQLLILLPGVLLIGIESVLVQYFSASGLPVAIPAFWVITLVVNISLTFALVPPYGARGAAIASSLSYALIFALVVFYFRAKTGRNLSSILLLRAQEWRSLFKVA